MNETAINILNLLTEESVSEKLAQGPSIAGGMSELKSPAIKYPAFAPPPRIEPPPPEAAPEVPVPTLKEGVQLTPSQIDFIKFINEKNGIGIAAWKAGAGKTLGTIASFLDMRKAGKAKKAIVLVPANLRENFAVQGVQKFTTATVGIIGTKQEAQNPEFNVEQMGEKDFYVISHDMFRENPDYYLKITGADTIIFDEMQRVRNPRSILNDVIEKAGSKVQNFIGATASPAMNRPFEAIELRNVISSKEERISEKQFQRKFLKRAPKDFWERVRSVFGGETTGPVVGFKAKEELRQLLGSSFHFAKGNIKGMPKKEVTTIEVPMTPMQEKSYKDILKQKLTKREMRILEKGHLYPDKELVPILNKIMAVRQLSNNARWVEGLDAPEAAASSPKILRMARDAAMHLNRNPKGKIIIYSNFIASGTKLMEAALAQRGIPFVTFYGKGQKGVTDKQRRGSIKSYRASKARVIIMSGAGSEGLSLPNTTMHMTMDPHYNPERIVQSEGRGIRRGGQAYLPPEKRRVQVRRYVSVPREGFSIDQSIYQIAAKKKFLVDQLKQIGMEAQRRRRAENPERARAYATFTGKPTKPQEMQKAARGGGYRTTHGSLDHGEVRLISDAANWVTEPTSSAGGGVYPYLHQQDYLPGKWSTRRKSEAEGKKKLRMKFTNKTDGALGPQPETRSKVKLGY